MNINVSIEKNNFFFNSLIIKQMLFLLNSLVDMFQSKNFGIFLIFSMPKKINERKKIGVYQKKKKKEKKIHPN